MSSRALPFVLLFAACAAPAGPSAPATAPLPPLIDVARIDALLARHVAAGTTPGLSAVIVHGGAVVLDKGYGNRSIEPALPVEPTTKFAIGSVTKQFTCACVLRLAEQGLLAIDDPVAKWFPSLTRAADITLRDLMQHTSGYPDYYPLDFVDRRMRQPIDPDALLREYAGGALDFEPGTEWSYSNTGYILLGRVVELVTGQPFGAVLQERLLQPLGLDETSYEPAPDGADLAHGYVAFAMGAPEPCAHEARGWIGAAGGLWSTARDLAKWQWALLDGRVLSPASWAAMTAPAVLRDGRETTSGFGLGLRVQHGRRVFAHSGAVDGYAAYGAIVPSTGSAIVLLANQSGGLGSLAGRVLDAMFEADAAAPAVAGPPAAEVASAIFGELQRGEPDRARFTADFDEYLGKARVAAAAARLQAYGQPLAARVTSTRERGGMEVTTTRLSFATGALEVQMYRHRDGKVAQWFVRAAD